MTWQKCSVCRIALALFRQHDWDFDRAIAAAFWLKNGRIIDRSYHRHWARSARIKDVPTIDVTGSEKLLRDYQIALGRFLGRQT